MTALRSSDPGATDDHSSISATGDSDELLRLLAAAPARLPGSSGLAPGAELAGRFQLVAERGRGGFGVVFEALDRASGARVAVKVLSRVDAHALYLFKHEFRALAGLAHPNLARLFELHADGERWLLAMEFIDGVSFLDHVRAEPSPARLREALGQLAAGLGALHDAGLVHRDVKPSNVLCTRDGRVVLVDFGLAQDVRAAAEGGPRVGTPRYMSPEQIAGEPLTPASDWYSVGLMLEGALAHAPDPELQALATELLARDPHRRPGGREVAARVRRGAPLPSVRPLVGSGTTLVARGAELGRLDAALARARSGTPAVVLCCGESGVGKSALVRHFLEGLGTSVTVLSNRCFEYEQIPFKAVDGVLDALSRALRELPDAEVRALVPDDVAVLAAQFPVLAAVPAIGAAPPRVVPEAQQARRISFRALRELLERLARRGPIAIFLDDLQWGDADSAALLAEVLRGPGAPAILVCGVFRGDGEDGPTVAALRELPGAEVLDVLPLPREAALALARTLAPGDGADGRAEAAVSEARGNPFLLQELARHALDAPGLPALAAAWVADLGPETRELLELVCLAGSPVERTALRRAAFDGSAAPDEEPRALAELRSRRLVSVAWRHEVEVLLPFHDRVREAVAGALDLAATRRLGGRLAHALEAAGAEPERLMFHFAQAGDAAAVVRYGLAAADRARAALAFGRAADLCRTVLVQEGLDAATAARVRVELARLLAADGRAGLAADAWLVAARAAGTQAQSIQHRQAAVEQLLVAGYGARGRAELGDLLRQLGVWLPGGRAAAVASWAAVRARLALRGLSFDERSEAQVGAGALARVDALRVAARGFFFLDPLAYLSLQARFLLAALEEGEPRRVAWALADEAFFACAGGTKNAAKTEALLARSTELVDRVGDLDGQVRNLIYRALASSNGLDGHSALGYLRAAEDRAPARAPGLSWEYDYARMIEASSLYTMGDYRRLVARAPALRRTAREGGNLHSEVTVALLVERAEALVIGRVDVLAPRVDQALAGVTASTQTGELYVRTNAGLDAALALGRLAEGEQILDRQWGRMRRAGLFLIQQVRMTLHAHRGLVALGLAARDPRHARKRLRTAASSSKALALEGAPWADAYSCALSAGVARLRGEAPRALLLIAEAERRFSDAHLDTHAASARRRRGEWSSDAERVREADETLRARGLADPALVAAMLLPDG